MTQVMTENVQYTHKVARSVPDFAPCQYAMFLVSTLYAVGRKHPTQYGMAVFGVSRLQIYVSGSF